MNLRSKIPFFLASIKRDKTQPIWLEYLQSDSSAFIDTGVSGNNNNLSLNMTFYIEKFFEYGGIFGNYIDENTNVFRVICAEDANRIFYNANTRAGNAAARSATNFFGRKHTLCLEKTKLTLDGVASGMINVNGTANDTNIALFNRSSANPFANVRDIGLKIYSCQMYDGDVMIRDFRPCLHPKTLEPCMYDMVTKNYFFNAGTGQFKYEYTFDTLEYIETDGNQWVDTGYTPSNNTRIVGSALFNEWNGNLANYVFGVFADNRNYGFNVGSSRRYFNVPWYTNVGVHDSGVFIKPELNTKFNFDISKNGCAINDIEFIDSSKLTAVFSATGPIYIGWSNGTTALGMIGRIYPITIYENTELKADYIPVRKLDGTVCIYDAVSNQYLHNQGTGSFIAGGYVQNLEDYERLEYLQSDGSCYIDTGILLGYDSKATVRVKTVNISTAQLVFGNNISGENFTCNIGNNNINISRFDGAKYTGSLYKDNTNVHTYTIDKSGIQVDDSIFAWDITPTNFKQTLSSYLFANRALTGAANFAKAGTRVYVFKVYEEEKLIQYLIPAKRKSDGVKGMLDMVSGQFLINQGTGEFE